MQKKIISLQVLLTLMISSSFLYFINSSTNFFILVEAAFYPITKPIISVCTGYIHSCAVFNSYEMKCWGYGPRFGGISQSGHNSTTIGDNIPYFNPGTGQSIVSVACLLDGICVVLSNGSIKCVGDNQNGQAGIGVTDEIVGELSGHVGDTLPTVNLGKGFVVKGIAGGSVHTCVMASDRKVKCFGWNGEGQLGYGDTAIRGLSLNQMGDNLPYVDLGTNVKVSSIHSGSISGHTCIVLLSPTAYAQRVKCWGINSFYQLGYGDTNNRGDAPGEMGDKLPLLDLGDESRVKTIALGYGHTCVLLVNDLIKCWGTQTRSQLGSGSTLDITSTGNSLPYVPIDSGKKIALVTAGMDHTCILYDDMTTMKCFGSNFVGQLGQGDSIGRGHTPETMIPFIPAIQLGTKSLKISSIYSGPIHNCVLFIDSTMKCFGWNEYGTFAIGSSETIGNDPNEMGTYLEFSKLFSPTQKPTKLPTAASKSPTLSPSNPTSLSVKKCNYSIWMTCKADSNCVWIGDESSGSCYEFICSLFNEVECLERSLQCKFDIVEKVCKPIKDQITKKPNKKPITTFKPTVSPGTSCTYKTKRNCGTDKSCKWKNKTCIPI